MLKIDLNNLFKINQEHGLSSKDLQESSSDMKLWLDKIEQRGQKFYKIIDDQEAVNKILQMAESFSGKFRDVVVLGIGGSALGTRCLYQALAAQFDVEIEDRKYPRLHVIDNVDPDLILGLENLIDYHKTLFITVSKSGNTPETLSLCFYFRSQLSKQGLNHKEHFVFITDPRKGFLRKIALEEGIKTIDHADVGGRFSVLSAVGLFPAALLGLDIRGLLIGAKVVRDMFLSQSWEDNLPYIIARSQYLLEKKNKKITVIFPYSQRLSLLGDWYRQLLAESIGKAQNDRGETVNVGLTPIKALGTTDQHSQSQLYNEGPNDKLHIFIRLKDHEEVLGIPNLYPSEEAVSFLDKVSFNELFAAEYRATSDVFTQNSRPNITIDIDKLDAQTLGELLMLFEGSIAFLGEFFRINAFNQPGVELAKQLTKKYLVDKLDNN